MTIQATTPIAAAVAAALLLSGSAASQDKSSPHSSSLQIYVHGAPPAPSDAWVLAAGGRIFDNWWDALDRKKPRSGNPSYPASGARTGATTWRCVECHGWDYKGRDGISAPGQPLQDRHTGIVGIDRVQRLAPDALVALMRKPPHNYTREMIDDPEMQRLARFVREGLHDADAHIDRKTGRAKGDASRGAAFFQTLCAACHGFDGRALNWGTDAKPGYIGTEANGIPWEVLHKIRNGHPGAAMINLRALPIQDAVDTLTYAQTLPAK